LHSQEIETICCYILKNLRAIVLKNRDIQFRPHIGWEYSEEQAGVCLTFLNKI
jgi:hypothetical protein